MDSPGPLHQIKTGEIQLRVLIPAGQTFRFHALARASGEAARHLLLVQLGSLGGAQQTMEDACIVSKPGPASCAGIAVAPRPSRFSRLL